MLVGHAALQSLLGKGSAITIFVHAINCNTVILKMQRPSFNNSWILTEPWKHKNQAASLQHSRCASTHDNRARACTHQVALCHSAPLLACTHTEGTRTGNPDLEGN